MRIFADNLEMFYGKSNATYVGYMVSFRGQENKTKHRFDANRKAHTSLCRNLRGHLILKCIRNFRICGHKAVFNPLKAFSQTLCTLQYFEWSSVCPCFAIS